MFSDTVTERVTCQRVLSFFFVFFNWVSTQHITMCASGCSRPDVTGTQTQVVSSIQEKKKKAERKDFGMCRVSWDGGGWRSFSAVEFLCFVPPSGQCQNTEKGCNTNDGNASKVRWSEGSWEKQMACNRSSCEWVCRVAVWSWNMSLHRSSEEEYWRVLCWVQKRWRRGTLKNYSGMKIRWEQQLPSIRLTRLDDNIQHFYLSLRA